MDRKLMHRIEPIARCDLCGIVRLQLWLLEFFLWIPFVFAPQIPNFWRFSVTQLDFLMQIDLMISGDGAVSVVTNLSDLKLFGVVFALPSSSEPATSEKFSTYISFLLLTFGNLENRVP
ncbi:unnamed protein product [Brassica rapa subsp. narinosa]